MDELLQSKLPILAAKRYRLRYLEKVIARYGPAIRPDLEVEHEGITRDIATLAQIACTEDTLIGIQKGFSLLIKRLNASVSAVFSRYVERTFLDNYTAAHARALPPLSTDERAAIEQQLQISLATFTQTMDLLTSELDFLPPAVGASARQRIDLARSAYIQLTTRFATLCPLTAASVFEIYRFIYALDQTLARLHLLELRQIHQRRLTIMQQRQAAHQSVGLTDAQRTDLQQALQHEQQAIQALLQPSGHQTPLVALHRRNRRWYQEMLMGQRPVLPIGLLNDMQDEEAALATIDQQLVHGE